MSNLLKEVRDLLPLHVEHANVDEAGPYLQGRDWQLRINGSWRLTPPSSAIDAAGGDSVERPVAPLADDDLVYVQFVKRELEFDVIFETQNGWKLELISEETYGQWLVTLWDSRDRSRIPLFSLEGPISYEVARING